MNSLALGCGLLLGLAVYLVLSRGGDATDAACVGGREHGWTACESQGSVCAPRGLPCRTTAPRD